MVMGSRSSWMNREVFSFDVDPEIVAPLENYGPKVMHQNADACDYLIQRLTEIRDQCLKCEEAMQKDRLKYSDSWNAPNADA
jgi:hypothetical protein